MIIHIHLKFKKNRLKFNKLILHVFSYLFTYFNSSIQRYNNLKIHKILINFNYILFSFLSLILSLKLFGNLT